MYLCVRVRYYISKNNVALPHILSNTAKIERARAKLDREKGMIRRYFERKSILFQLYSWDVVKGTDVYMVHHERQDAVYRSKLDKLRVRSSLHIG